MGACRLRVWQLPPGLWHRVGTRHCVSRWRTEYLPTRRAQCSTLWGGMAAQSIAVTGHPSNAGERNASSLLCPMVLWMSLGTGLGVLQSLVDHHHHRMYVHLQHAIGKRYGCVTCMSVVCCTIMEGNALTLGTPSCATVILLCGVHCEYMKA
jgi:hypothetical protein